MNTKLFCSIGFACCVWFSNVCAKYGGDYFEVEGTTKLRTTSTGGYVEYEFFKNGDLNSYVYTNDTTSSGQDVVDEPLVPKFQVFSLKWEIDGDYLIIYRGAKESRARIKNDDKFFYFMDKAWERIDSLRFFRDLDDFSKGPKMNGRANQ